MSDTPKFAEGGIVKGVSIPDDCVVRVSPGEWLPDFVKDISEFSDEELEQLRVRLGLGL